MTTKHRIFAVSFASVYPLYIAKAEKKGRKKSEVDAVICCLTGYDQRGLKAQLKKQKDIETFFKEAPRLNPGPKHTAEFTLLVRVRDASRKEVEHIDISSIDTPIGYWKWKEGEFR